MASVEGRDFEFYGNLSQITFTYKNAKGVSLRFFLRQEVLKSINVHIT